MAEPSSFLISELTGDENVLELQGRALPYRPIRFSGSMRAEFTWYPGNPNATIQMLGPQESPSTVNGMWKDRFIKSMTDGMPGLGIPPLPVLGQTGKAYHNGSLVIDVFDLVRLTDGFRRRGQLLEVFWDEHLRRGIMTKFDHTWLRREDVEWEMEFSWSNLGDPITPVGFGIDLSILDLINEIVAAINDLIDSIQELFNLIDSIKNAINSAIDAIQDAVNAITDLAKQAAALAMAPLEIAKGAMSCYETIKDQAQSIIDTVTSLPARAIRTAKDIAGVTEQEALQSEAWVRSVKQSSRKLRSLAAQRQQELSAQTINQPQAGSITTFQGQNLRDVSTKFFGTPDEWKRIGQHNNVQGSILPAGKTIIIPKLTRASQVGIFPKRPATGG